MFHTGALRVGCALFLLFVAAAVALAACGGGGWEAVVGEGEAEAAAEDAAVKDAAAGEGEAGIAAEGGWESVAVESATEAFAVDEAVAEDAAAGMGEAGIAAGGGWEALAVEAVPAGLPDGSTGGDISQATEEPAGGDPGAGGADGTDGADGADGTDGTDGTDGGDGTDDGVRAEYVPPMFTDGQLDAMDVGKIGWGVKLDGHSRPGVPKSRQDMLDRYGAFYIGAAGEPTLYLTFDLGYENGQTASILDTLRDKGVHAAFFVVGHYIDTAPELVGRMLDEGHLVCNHTRSHKSLPDITDEKLADEIDGFAATFHERFGVELARFLRPPNGEYSERALALAAQMGWRTALWSFAYVDYDEANMKGEKYAFEKITGNLHDGAVILLHATSSDNARALGRVIDAARDMGYGFGSLDEIAWQH